MLPADLGKEELMCVEQLCEELGLVVHHGDKVSVASLQESCVELFTIVVSVCYEGYQASRCCEQQ